MSCGENHNLLLTDKLQIHSCGSNTYGQLGIGNMNVSLLHQQNPNQLGGQGVQSTIFRVKNFYNESLASNSTDRRESQSNDSTKKEFQQISCGSEHSFALSSEGDLYSWGLNFKGQLGLGDFENRYEPTLVESLSPIDSLSS